MTIHKERAAERENNEAATSAAAVIVMYMTNFKITKRIAPERNTSHQSAAEGDKKRDSE